MLKTAAVIFLGTLMICAAPQPARAQQTLNFTLGYFAVRGEDARAATDQLRADRQFLTFNVNDLNGATVGGEWLVPFGNFFEGGIGVGFTSHTTPSVYTNFTAPDGSEVVQQLHLRTVPVSFTARVIPTGQHSVVQPYFGAGIAVIPWRYTETGDFIDFSAANSIFHDSFAGSGTATGPVVLGGIRFAGSSAAAGFEVRYQHAMANLPPSEFATGANPAPTIDLGGWTYQATVGYRFGR